MGITISLAGIPRIKAKIIGPSSPIYLENGSRNVEIYIRRLFPSMKIWDRM